MATAKTHGIAGSIHASLASKSDRLKSWEYRKTHAEFWEWQFSDRWKFQVVAFVTGGFEFAIFELSAVKDSRGFHKWNRDQQSEAEFSRRMDEEMRKEIGQ